MEQIKGDKTREWSLRYGLLESIQIVIDIACHVVVEKNLGNAETYSDCFTLLRENDYLTVEMEEKLTGMAGMRNVLVHEYVAVELQQLYDALDHLEDFTEFAKMVRKEFN